MALLFITVLGNKIPTQEFHVTLDFIIPGILILTSVKCCIVGTGCQQQRSCTGPWQSVLMLSEHCFPD